MPEFVIRPYEGFGPVNFGMTQEEIVAMLGRPDFDPAVAGQLIYRDLGLTVAFDAGGEACWVASNFPPCYAIVEGIRLVGPYHEVTKALTSRGYQLRRGRAEEADHGSTYCDALGVYVGRVDPEANHIDTIGAWRMGYWEEERARAAAELEARYPLPRSKEE